MWTVAIFLVDFGLDPCQLGKNLLLPFANIASAGKPSACNLLDRASLKILVQLSERIISYSIFKCIRRMTVFKKIPTAT
jgi:hypothetical protein